MMRLVTVTVLLLVAVVCGYPSSINQRTRINPKSVLRDVPPEVLDQTFDTFVTIYRTIIDTYPQELLQEVVAEVLANDGAFNFSPELRAKLDEKRLEMSVNLKTALVGVITGGEELPDDILEKIRTYFDFAVDFMLSLTPYDLFEEIVKEVLNNGGSFEFSPELWARIDDTKRVYKDASKKLLDYEFEVFEELIDIDEEFRLKLYEAVDFMIERMFDAIPWNLLEDITYFILENDGSLDLTSDLLERIELTKDDLREKLREALDAVDALLNEGVKYQTSRVVSDEFMDIVYQSIVAIVRTGQDVFKPELLEQLVNEILNNEGSFDFTPELITKLDEAVEQYRDELKENFLNIALASSSLPDLDEEGIDTLRKYFDYSVNLLIALFPTELIEEISKEVLRNGGSFEFSPEINALIAESLQQAKIGFNGLFDYEFEIFPELAELSDETIGLIHQAIDYVVEGMYEIFPWSLMEEIWYEIVTSGGSFDFSPELSAKIEPTLLELGEKLRELMDAASDVVVAP